MTNTTAMIELLTATHEWAKSSPRGIPCPADSMILDIDGTAETLRLYTTSPGDFTASDIAAYAAGLARIVAHNHVNHSAAKDRVIAALAILA